MLHSGSRGIGNAIGIVLHRAREEGRGEKHVALPDRDLAYFPEGAQHFDDYVEAVGWAQDYARANREEMMDLVLDAHAPAPAAVRRHRRRRSTATTTTSSARRTTASRCGSRARARSARRGRARHHPRQHGRAQLHRARQGLGRELPLLRARRRAPDEPKRRAEEIFRSRTWKTQTQGVIAARTRACSTRSPAPTRTSTR